MLELKLFIFCLVWAGIILGLHEYMGRKFKWWE